MNNPEDNKTKNSGQSTLSSASKKTIQTILQLDVIVKFLKNLTILFLFAILTPFVYKILTKSTIVVQDVTVPTELENRGLTGRVFSQRVIDKILEIANYTEVLKEREDIYGLSKKNQRPDIDLPITIFGINLETLLSFLKTAAGGQDVRVTGEVVTEKPSLDNGNIPAEYSVRFRVAKVGTIYKSTTPDIEIDKLAEKAAIGVMEEYEPITMAYYYRGQKKLADAYRMTEKAIIKKRQGDVVWAHFVRGLLESDHARWTFAEDEFRFVLDHDPTFPRAINNLSQNLRRQGKFEQALEQAENAIKVEPNRSLSYLNKAWAMVELGQIQEARPWLQKAIEVETENETGHMNMGDYYRRFGQLDLAVKHYRLALDIKPNASSIHTNLAGSLGDMGRWKEAEAVTQKALTYNPRNGIALGYIGYIALQRGDYDRARQYYDEAFKVDPAYFRYYIGHARIAMKEQDFERAEELLNQAQKINPRWWDIYKFKGDLALLRGDKNNAMSLYEQSSKLNQKAPDVLARIAWLAQDQNDQDKAQRYAQMTVEMAPYVFPDEASVLKNFKFLP